MTINRVPEKKSQFQKIRKLQNLIHFNKLISRASVVLKFFLIQTSVLLQMLQKDGTVLPLANLGAAELGSYYSNVYGKISFAPLNILGSVCLSKRCILGLVSEILLAPVPLQKKQTKNAEFNTK